MSGMLRGYLADHCFPPGRTMTHARCTIELTLAGLLAASAPCLGADVQAEPARIATQTAPPAGASLYARMGGTATVTAVVNELIDHSAADPRLKRSFEGVNLDHVKKMLIEQLCSLTGGGCTYTGDSMRDVHAGLKIDQSEFYGLVESLRIALQHHGVALRERNELLEILAPMKRDVVER